MRAILAALSVAGAGAAAPPVHRYVSKLKGNGTKKMNLLTMIDPDKPAPAAGAREIILVVADDLSGPGWRSAVTPHLDALEATGAFLENARISGSDRLGVCAPSRAALLTGRAVFDAYNFGSVRAVPTFTRHVSLPEKLRLAGYATTAVGKWHADVNSYNHGFEYGRAVLFRPMGSTHFARAKASNESFGPLPLVDVDPGENSRGTQIFNPTSIRDELLLPFPRRAADLEARRRLYGGLVASVDAAVGALDAASRPDRILVVTSDHGIALDGRHGLIGKQNLYEHSNKVPLLVHGCGPLVAGGAKAHVYLHDVAPTLVALSRSRAPPFTAPIGAQRKYERMVVDTATNLKVIAHFNSSLKGRGDTRGAELIAVQAFDVSRDPDELDDLVLRDFESNAAAAAHYAPRLPAAGDDAVGALLREACDLERKLRKASATPEKNPPYGCLGLAAAAAARRARDDRRAEDGSRSSNATVAKAAARGLDRVAPGGAREIRRRKPGAAGRLGAKAPP
ncbi:arylsulfatase A-like protein [Aureococcus anophagefferens]|nr:arylsulfatase A-like protein [Aureococcus anophagefferens]